MIYGCSGRIIRHALDLVALRVVDIQRCKRLTMERTPVVDSKSFSVTDWRCGETCSTWEDLFVCSQVADGSGSISTTSNRYLDKQVL